MASPPTETGTPAARLVHVSLDGEPLTRLSPLLEADRAQADADLQAENRFAPLSHPVARDAGPYALHLSIYEGRLVFSHYLIHEKLRTAMAFGQTAMTLVDAATNKLVKEWPAEIWRRYQALK